MKKLFAILLALLLMLLPALPACASAAEAERDVPYIYVHGFMGVTVYEDANDPDSPAVWPPATDDILSIVKNHLGDIARLTVDHNYDRFADAVMPDVSALFEPAINRPDGTVEEGSGPHFSYPAPAEISASSKLDFDYDWRLDPMVIASQLNDFINYVLECSGRRQVVLECHSFGGVVTMTYARMFGSEKLRGVVFNTTAIYGEDYNGELMTGHLSLDADALTAYLKAMLSDHEYAKLISGLLELLNTVNLTDAVCALGNRIIEKLSDRVLPEIIVPLFGGWLSVWSMIPDPFIDDAMDYVFNTIYKDSDIDRSALIEKIKTYNTEIREGKTEFLQQMNEGTDVYVISRYNFPGVFLTPSWVNMSDTTIDTKYSSFGATTSAYNGTLTDAQLAGVDPVYISPEKTINAATCLFPEQTWFIKDLAHAKNPDSTREMYQTLLYAKGQQTVDSFEAYPRYLVYDSDTGALSPNGGSPAAPTLFEKISAFFQSAYEKLQALYIRIMRALFPKV